MDFIWTNGSWQVLTTSNDFVFHYFILSISLSLVLSYSSNGTQFISLSSIIDKVQRKGGQKFAFQERRQETHGTCGCWGPSSCLLLMRAGSWTEPRGPTQYMRKNCGEDQPSNYLRKDRKLAILGNFYDRQVTQNLSREGRLVRPPAKEKEKSKPLPLKRKKGKVVTGRSFDARRTLI